MVAVPITSGDGHKRTGRSSSVSLDELLKPDFPTGGQARGKGHRGDVEVDADGAGSVASPWERTSKPVHLDPKTYVPQVAVPDEVLTRMYADQGRPHPILNRPPPQPDEDENEFFNDPATWEFREELRECESCGEPFLANAHNHRYCSRTCARAGRSHLRICVACGEQFETDRAEQVYCSVQCSGRAKRNPDNDRACRECGGPFHATRKQQVFCSRGCAWAWRKRERKVPT